MKWARNLAEAPSFNNHFTLIPFHQPANRIGS